MSNNKSRASLKKKKTQVNKQVKNIEDWIREGEDYSIQFEFSKAYSCFEQALKIDPNNAAILDTIGEVALELGKFKNAIEFFTQSIKISPDDSPSKYMNLGQLVGGDDAVKLYSKGVQIMEFELQKLLNNNNNNNKPFKSPFSNQDEEMDLDKDEDEYDPIEGLKLQICSGLCSIAELYLTDQCFDDNAEVECEKHLQRAIQVSPTSPESYSLMASMKISQVKHNEALDYLYKSYKLWEHAEIDERPEFEYRFDVSLLFIELKEYKVAIGILEDLVSEQDNVVEIWISLAQAYFYLNEPLSAQDCIISAKELLKEAIDGLDESLEKQINDLTVQIDKQVKLLPPDVIAKHQLGEEDEEDEEMI